jgi:uncharacterized protein (DUF736 family)
METNMTHIGIFRRNKDGYTGTIRTLTLDREIDIKSAKPSQAANAPQFRILAGDIEVGSGWKRTGERAGEYISLLIDDPSFAHPIRANLFHLETDSDVFHLSWTRPLRSEKTRQVRLTETPQSSR